MPLCVPTRSEVLQTIDMLRRCPETRAQIAAWAIAIVDDANADVTDVDVWKVLKNLGGVDLVGDASSYLFNDQDFADWKSELDN